MILQNPNSKIRQKLESYRSEIRENLFSLVKIPSVRSESKERAPFGEGCAKALSAVRELQENCGYKTVINEEDGYLTAHAGNLNGKKTIGLFAHADVVPTGDGWVFTSPFEPIEKDGILIGRGVCDNKAGIMMSLYAAKVIDELNLPLKSRLLLFTGSNEESGMADIKAFVKKESIPDLSLVPDNSFPVNRGECGVLRWYAVSDTAFSDAVVSVNGGKAFNAVLGTADVVLKYSKELEGFLERSVSEDNSLTFVRDCDTLILTAHGVTGHAAAPGNAIHAVYLLSKLLSQCDYLTQSDRDIFAKAADLTVDCYGGGFGISFNDPDFGRLTCINGIASCVDGILSLTFDCRYGTSLDSEALESAIVERLKSIGWNFRLHDGSSGYLVSKDSPIVRSLLSVYRECTGEYNAESCLSGGGTYARRLKNAFSMGDFGFNTPFDVPKGHGGVHQPDEMIQLDGLLDATAILIEMILACDSYLN